MFSGAALISIMLVGEEMDSLGVVWPSWSMIMFKIATTAFNPWLTMMMRPFLAGLPEQTFEKPASMAVQWSEFLNLRFQEDVAFWGRLACCRTPQDVQQTYVDFWRTAWAQYQGCYRAVAGAAQPKDEMQVAAASSQPRYKAAA